MWQRTTPSAMLACTTASSQPATLRGFFDGPLPRSQTETCQEVAKLQRARSSFHCDGQAG